MRTETTGPVPSARAPRRVALYSHDTQGLGHVRRNIAVAASLVAAAPGTAVLLLSGAPEATSLPLPPGTEVLTLPSLRKSRSGDYRPAVLDLTLREVLSLRSRLIGVAVDAFAPDLLVVDKVARGVHGELDPVLERLGPLGAAGRPRTVLGLRDVLDDPVVARRDWARQRTTSAVEEHYDQVWMYGDPRVHDPVTAYDLPAVVGDRTVSTGYLGHGRADAVRARPGAPGQPAHRGPYVLCLVGGGQDGVDVARCFAGAEMPPGHTGIVVTGPYMHPRLRAELQVAAARRSDLEVREFVTDVPQLVAGARAVVSMGGYNSVCEVLAAGTPALVVPRVVPRTEQAVRADRLAELGEVDTLRPDAVDAGRLARWLAAAVHRPHRRSAVDLDGLSRLPALAAALVSRPHQEVNRVPA